VHLIKNKGSWIGSYYQSGDGSEERGNYHPHTDLPTFENAKKGDLGEIAPQKGRFFSPNQEILGRFFHTKEGDWGDYPLQTGDLGEIQLK